MKAETLCILVVLFIAGLFVAVFAHELTHLFSFSQPQGICIGICGGNGLTFAVGRAYGVYSPAQGSELLPNLVGVLAGVFFIVSAMYCIRRRLFD